MFVGLIGNRMNSAASAAAAAAAAGPLRRVLTAHVLGFFVGGAWDFDR